MNFNYYSHIVKPKKYLEGVLCIFGNKNSCRSFSKNTGVGEMKRIRDLKLVIVGGGAGGTSVASKFSRILDRKLITVVEPSNVHYYQPMWTLVGGGIKTLAQSARSMKSTLPGGVNWVQDQLVHIVPDENKIVTKNGQEISYDFLVIALGIQLNYEKIKGLPEAFNYPGVCSNYSHLYVEKTFETLKNFKGGNAIFTFPNTPIKCAGAPQKILYLAEDYLKMNGKRSDANLIFNTALPVLFGVKKYADSLWNIVKERNIKVNLRQNLVQVLPKERKAVFENLDNGEFSVYEYSMLHITPPMGPTKVLIDNKQLADQAGYLNINMQTLQHEKYENIFGIGDCTNLPTSKTAAAVAAQCGILSANLLSVMNGNEVKVKYDGYTSCPLVTSYNTCIMAEFDYNAQPLETFPFNQAKERKSMFYLKRDLMPNLYWKLMLNGYWNGPAAFRNFFNFYKK